MGDKCRHLTIFFQSDRYSRTTCWQPQVDTYRIPNGWLLKFDLAGVRPEDVNVQISGSRVTVSGLRRDWMLEEGASYYSMEISYNRFERSVQLPSTLELASYSLESRNGILFIRIQARS
jgi:HSP20 family protein